MARHELPSNLHFWGSKPTEEMQKMNAKFFRKPSSFQGTIFLEKKQYHTWRCDGWNDWTLWEANGTRIPNIQLLGVTSTACRIQGCHKFDLVKFFWGGRILMKYGRRGADTYAK